MPELAEFFSPKGAKGGKPSAGGASKGPSASTPSNSSARSERYPTAAQLNANPPAKSPTKQAAKNTGRPPKDPPCTQGSSGDGRRQVGPKKTGIISAYILRYCSYQ